VIVHLGLRKIERVFPLDVASAHVVADGVADELQARRQHQGKLRLGDAPLAVAADMDAVVGAGDAVRRRLEEYFRSRRRIDEVVELGRPDRLALAGLLASLVGDARRPDFLVIDRRKQREVAKRERTPFVDELAGQRRG